MAQISPRTILLYTGSTLTASATGVDMVLPGLYTAAIVRVVAGTFTGTSPTLNVYIQQGIRDAAGGDLIGNDTSGSLVYDDFISFTQLTAAGTRFARVVGGGNVESAAADVALTAGSIRNGPIGDRWRVKFVIGGTTPSIASLSVVVQLIP